MSKGIIHHCIDAATSTRVEVGASEIRFSSYNDSTFYIDWTTDKWPSLRDFIDSEIDRIKEENETQK